GEGQPASCLRPSNRAAEIRRGQATFRPVELRWVTSYVLPLRTKDPLGPDGRVRRRGGASGSPRLPSCRNLSKRHSDQRGRLPTIAAARTGSGEPTRLQVGRRCSVDPSLNAYPDSSRLPTHSPAMKHTGDLTRSRVGCPWGKDSSPLSG